MYCYKLKKKSNWYITFNCVLKKEEGNYITKASYRLSTKLLYKQEEVRWKAKKNKTKQKMQKQIK